MIRSRHLIMFLGLFVVASVNASAFPMFLAAYKSDKFTNPQNKDVVCNFCHMSPSGGDDRNPFGQAFERGGEVFTPMLRAQFPDRFSYPMTKVNDNLTIHFSDPDNKVIIVESNGRRVEVDASKQTVDGKPAGSSNGSTTTAQPATGAATAAGRPAAAAVASSPAPQTSDVPTDPYAREGAFFGQNVVDLPNGKPQRKGGVDFLIGHRFPEAVFQSNTAPDLFGFDSQATVTFGFRVGLTDRLSVGVARSSYNRTIEFSSNYQLSRQGGKSPLTLQARALVEGRNNFIRDTDAGAPIQWVGYAPSLQVVATRTFADRFSFELVPTFAFNTRNELSFLPQYGVNHNNTIAIGAGAGFRFLKTASIVGEFTPRVWGYGGELTKRPEIGFGIEKSTFRHTFALVFTDTRSMTVNRYAQGTGGDRAGGDFFGIGFNIFRRIR